MTYSYGMFNLDWTAPLSVGVTLIQSWEPDAAAV